FLVGYFKQDYNSSTLQSPSGLAVRAVFNWTPDKQTLIVPSLERSVLESTTAGASSMVRTALTVLARRELQRNLVASVFGGVYYDA
ncbi:outer membrane beta-barrel protein, partial [Escherichia coli]|uniref:outer membrane beta-barrel protein n=1 Tax=Escherichia coli TaxID=562 RepID=UPI0039DF6A9E